MFAWKSIHNDGQFSPGQVKTLYPYPSDKDMFFGIISRGPILNSPGPEKSEKPELWQPWLTSLLEDIFLFVIISGLVMIKGIGGGLNPNFEVALIKQSLFCWFQNFLPSVKIPSTFRDIAKNVRAF